MQNGDVKTQNKRRIARLVYEKGEFSRQEIATELGMSLPTVFQNVTDLVERGLLYESGAYGSTGGRKAKTLSVSKHFRFTLGVDITRHHLRFVTYDISGELGAEEYLSFPYADSESYYQGLAKSLEAFIDKNGVDRERLVGVGLSIPGIVNPVLGVVSRSHALEISNVPLRRFSEYFSYPVYYGNDAKNAAYAEIGNTKRSIVYLALNDTVGGAFYHQGHNYYGDGFKSAEFGHMVIVPGGKKCYCGKQGCVDAYCSAKALVGADGNLEEFFQSLGKGDAMCKERFAEYLDYLAITVTNLRMAYDCDIILGGNVGGYLSSSIDALKLLLPKYDLFDADCSYLHTGTYKKESSAVGAAKRAVNLFLDALE